MNRYNSYKDSGVEWIGEIPEHWQNGRVKNLIDNSKYYQIGLKQAEQYLRILSEEEINNILEIYKYGNGKRVEI